MSVAQWLLFCLLFAWLATVTVVYLRVDPSGARGGSNSGIDLNTEQFAKLRSTNEQLNARLRQLESVEHDLQRQLVDARASEQRARSELLQALVQLRDVVDRAAALSSSSSSSWSLSTLPVGVVEVPKPTTSKSTTVLQRAVQALTLSSVLAGLAATSLASSSSSSSSSKSAAPSSSTSLCGLQAPVCRHNEQRFLTYTQGGGFNNQRQSVERAFQV